MIALVVAFVVAIFLIQHFYDTNRLIINTVWLEFNRAMLLPWTLVSSRAALIHAKLGAANPLQFTAGNLLAQTTLAGEYWRWVVAPAIGYCAYVVYIRAARITSLTQSHNMQSLLKQQGLVFPAVRPVAMRKRSVLDEPLDVGPWRVARSPIQFAAENRLIYSKEKGGKSEAVPQSTLILKNGLVNLDSDLWDGDNALRKRQSLFLHPEATKSVFEKQIGRNFSSWDQEPAYVQALAACFMLYATGRKADGKKWIDRMNLTFTERSPIQPNKTVDASGALDIINDITKENGGDRAVRRTIQLHGNFSNVLMMALLVLARKKAMLPPSQFLWLRPTDRPLWYALHQMGGRMPWAEAAAPWSHYYAVERLGSPISTPHINEAIEGLQKALDDDGWFGKVEKYGTQEDRPAPKPEKKDTAPYRNRKQV